MGINGLMVTIHLYGRVLVPIKHSILSIFLSFPVPPLCPCLREFADILAPFKVWAVFYDQSRIASRKIYLRTVSELLARTIEWLPHLSYFLQFSTEAAHPAALEIHELNEWSAHVLMVVIDWIRPGIQWWREVLIHARDGSIFRNYRDVSYRRFYSNIGCFYRPYNIVTECVVS